MPMPHRAPVFALQRRSWTEPGSPPAYAVEVRHKEDHAQQQATEVHLKDAQTLARDVLRALPEVVSVLPPDEVKAVLNELPIMR